MKTHSLFALLPAQQLADSCSGTRLPSAWFMSLSGSPAMNCKHPTQHPKEGRREHEPNAFIFPHFQSLQSRSLEQRGHIPLSWVLKTCTTWPRALTLFPKASLHVGSQGFFCCAILWALLWWKSVIPRIPPQEKVIIWNKWMQNRNSVARFHLWISQLLDILNLKGKMFWRKNHKGNLCTAAFVILKTEAVPTWWAISMAFILLTFLIYP